ncbi:MAG TPA: hypothetical protein VFA11_10285 [Acidimicrobiales bacterium]|nr:hypothetical protein [Acidimicrobiales bacterium]
MISRRKLIVAAGLVSSGALALAPMAHAAPSGSTVATITLTSTGSLDVSVPAGTTSTPVNLGSTVSTVGSWTAPNSLGAVTVTDSRAGQLTNNWTATAATTAFNCISGACAGTGMTNPTSIPVTAITYNEPVASVSSSGAGTEVFTPVATVSLATGSAPVGSMVAVGTNTATWSPTLTFLLNGQVAGTYEGTITHSVA